MVFGAVSFAHLLFENSAPPMPAKTVTDLCAKNEKKRKPDPEGWFKTMAQLALPFLVAGLGLSFAGMILESAAKLSVYKRLPALIALATPLVGIKGNGEMTLASRLSTHSNLGTLRGKFFSRICRGNLCLVQFHAVTMGLGAAAFTVTISIAFQGTVFTMNDILLICAGAVITTSIASLLLGCLMIGIIVLCDNFKINPDNCATPLAGCLGDIVTLSLFSRTVCLLDRINNSWVFGTVLCLYSVVMVAMAVFASKNDFTASIVLPGFVPLGCGMIISSGGGFIMDFGQKVFPTIALYQPLINGLGGNMVAVYASKMSTFLYVNSPVGEPRVKTEKVFMSPLAVFFGTDSTSVTARVLILLVIPGQLMFFSFSSWVSPDAPFTFWFLLSFLTASVTQVAFLIYLANILLKVVWNSDLDTDTQAIPFLTAAGDLLGSALLLSAFYVISVSI